MLDRSVEELIPISSVWYSGGHVCLGDQIRNATESPRIVRRFTVHDKAWWWAYWQDSIPEASWDVDQTRHTVSDACVYRAKNSADANEVGFPVVRNLKKDKGTVLPLFRRLPNVRLAYKISACEVCIICRKPTAACVIRCQSWSWRLNELQMSH